MPPPTTLVWFRQDLRLTDHPALHEAVKRGGPIVPVFIWSMEESGGWPRGAASRWWLHQSLLSLSKDLEARGSRLILRQGPAREQLQALAEESQASLVVWNRVYEPAHVLRDKEIMQRCEANGLEVRCFPGSLLHEPWEVQTAQGNPYQVFTPFWKACLQRPAPGPVLKAPTTWPTPSSWPQSCSLPDLQLEPSIPWADGFRTAWQPGEAGARQRLQTFLDGPIESYLEDRNRPGLMGTSRLSPHLHCGEISPRQIWHAITVTRAGKPAAWQQQADGFLREVYWREFAYHLLHHFPRTIDQPLREAFQRFPWRHDPRLLKAWQRGNTGYPIVDAGLRELWHTGWMHNRVRMIAASFLVKHLLIPWQEGARWFWDTLVDADLANNTLGWQWTAGCGADAAPYFRIFNPILQGKKFDPKGAYVKRWVPELARLPLAWLHEPWAAPKDILREAGVQIGQTYPAPVVDHAQARQAALAAFASLGS